MPCVDCHDAEGSLDIRRRRLCPDCFTRYVSSKVLKRMESYRFKVHKGQRKHKLLLPLSGGLSSLVLLHILDAQLQRQIAKQNQTAYELSIVHVEIGETTDPKQGSNWVREVRNQFPTYTVLEPQPLDQAFSYDADLESDTGCLGLQRQLNEADAALSSRFLSSATSMTAQRDLEEVMLNRLIVAIAKKHDCEGILWGHSDSRLAAITLSNVAKGRGNAVPGTIADGPSTFGVNSNYPLRDLFEAELELYLSFVPQDILKLVAVRRNNSKNGLPFRETAIDDLLNTYITSQGVKYPSIMANVVRTAGKLQIPDQNNADHVCRVCRQLDSRSLKISESSLCYGCQRMKQDLRVT